MDQKSIEGYATACRILYDALDGHIDSEKLANTYDKAQENPKVGLATLHSLALRNHVIDEEAKRNIADALDQVTPGEEPATLTLEEQGTFALAWYRANPPQTYSVTEAAKILGRSRATIVNAIHDGRLEATREPDKPLAAWAITEKSLREEAKRSGIPFPELL